MAVCHGLKNLEVVLLPFILRAGFEEVRGGVFVFKINNNTRVF